MATKWFPTKLKNFDDVSNILSISNRESIVNNLFTIGSTRRSLPCERAPYFFLGGTTLPHDLGLLIKVSHADNWKIQPTFEWLVQLVAKRYDTFYEEHEEHTASVESGITSGFEEGKAYYERNKDLLTREYNGEYIAIWDDEVVDHDASFSKLAQRVYKKLGYVSIYMPFVTTKRQVLRFESPERRSANVS